MGRGTLIKGAVFLVVGFSARTATSQQLRGSDTLFDVVNSVISGCTGASGLTYLGGGDDLGQAVMAGGAQHVAPMARQLDQAQCTANSRQLLIGLEAVSILTKNAQHTDPSGGTCGDDIGGSGSAGASGPLVLTGIPDQFVVCTADAQCAAAGGTTCDTARQFCNIGGAIAGCTAAQGCSPAGTYTFDNGNGPGSDDWRDVLAQIYGGMNHTGSQTLITVPAGNPDATNGDGTYICQIFTSFSDGTACSSSMLCPAGQYCDAGTCFHLVPGGAVRNCVRNPARIDCANPVRGVLLASYTQIVRNPVCTVNSPIAC